MILRLPMLTLPAWVSRYFKLINFVIFQLVWAISVFGQSQYIYLSVLLLATHFALSPSKKTDLKVMMIIASIGIPVDYALTMLGVFEFTPLGFPLWLMVLWLGFALAMAHSLAWMGNLSLGLRAIIGAFGGASSYVAGYFIGAVDFPLSLTLTTIILTILWAVLIPVFLTVVKRYAP